MRQDRPKMPQERSKSGQEGSWNDFGVILRHLGAILGSKMCVFPYVFQYFLNNRVFAFTSLPEASWSRLKWPRAPQERPRAAQRGPKIATRRPKIAIRSPKSGPRATLGGQEGSWSDLEAILRHFGAILGSKMCGFPYVFQYFLNIRVFAFTSLPKASWSRLKWPRAPQERPRDPQEEPKSDPRAAKSGKNR